MALQEVGALEWVILPWRYQIFISVRWKNYATTWPFGTYSPKESIRTRRPGFYPAHWGTSDQMNCIVAPWEDKASEWRTQHWGYSILSEFFEKIIYLHGLQEVTVSCEWYATIPTHMHHLTETRLCDEYWFLGKIGSVKVHVGARFSSRALVRNLPQC